jgi:WD40 repeat protein
VNGGVKSLSWLNGETLVVGCEEHAIKLIDAERGAFVKQSILTQHKVPTCMDCSQGSLILSGSEDATIRLWDTR